VEKRAKASRGVEGASGVIKKRIGTDAGIAGPRGVGEEGECSVGRVTVADGIAKERAITDGCIGAALGVAKQGQYAICCVVEACGVVQKRCRPIAVFCVPSPVLWFPTLKRSVPAPTAAL